ncbi:hypothetical protein LSH36_212g04053 [Paralvinella palmiformis]|uniref:MIP18 family-like domain-containing protein n=1 Tax=Paralvinella palmiformis TaxID=53620 RepID=A0AAD9N4K0_9ANNE|nr:hypothetical protein LSH36_212g04053 [Paralvinella palmiformis]
MSLQTEWTCSREDVVNNVYDLIRDIRDPEKDNTLEELNVVCEDCVTVSMLDTDTFLVRVEFTPTVSHCSMATLIGLCLRVKLQRCLPQKHKLDIFIKEGSHDTEKEVNKQINDKERVMAALENTTLLNLVEECIAEPE